MDSTDGALARAARDGRRDAMDELVRRHARPVAATCWARVGRRGPVEDLVQETFLRAFRTLGSLEDPDAFVPWVHRIAANVSLDWLRRKERSEQPLESEPAQPQDDSEERRRALLEAVQGLPEIYREVVVQFYFEKRSYKDMSAALGITAAAVNARLQKARALLRERMVAP